MSNETNTPTNIEAFAAEFHDVARYSEHARCVTLHEPGSNKPILLREPPAAAADPVVGVGFRAARASLMRRREVIPVENDRRFTDDGRAPKFEEIETKQLREVLAAHADLVILEGNAASAERRLYDQAPLDKTDATGATFEAEARSYLRGLSREERVQAIRSDARLLAAAMRAPRMAGIVNEHEFGGLVSEWRSQRDAAEPVIAQQVADLKVKTAWSRGAITVSARAFAGEAKTAAAMLVAQLDPVDTARFVDVFDIPRGSMRAEVRQRAS